MVVAYIMVVTTYNCRYGLHMSMQLIYIEKFLLLQWMGALTGPGWRLAGDGATLDGRWCPLPPPNPFGKVVDGEALAPFPFLPSIESNEIDNTHNMKSGGAV